jgi:O-antigen ligase
MTFTDYKEKYHFSVNFYSMFLLVTFIPDLLHFDAALIKYSFWGVRIFLCFWVYSKEKLYLSKFTPVEILFVVLSLLYAVRIFVDAFLQPLSFVADKEPGDFFGFCIDFFLALSFRYNSAYYSEKSFKFFCTTLTIGLLLAFHFARENWELDGNNLRYDANSTVNSINYGQMGLALSLVSIYGLITYKKKLALLLFICLFVIGMLSVAKAGSRSPIVVLILVTIFFLIARFGGLKGILIFSIVVGLIFLNLDSLTHLLESTGSTLTVRLTSMVENDAVSGRNEIYANTFNIIKQSPLWGAYYIVPYGDGAGSYPHNFILEVFMATGLIGGIPFLILVGATLIKGYKIIQSKHPASWIILLYLQVIGYGMFSMGLYSSQDCWMLMFYTLSIPTEASAIANPKQQLAYANR